MKYSYNWLKELTKTEKSPEELAQMVMLKGFELEGKEILAKRFDKFVVGEILEIKRHPNADKLQLAKVDIGNDKLDVVCGAFNIKVGDKVPVAMIGAIIPQKKIKIARTEIRGVESNGMLCAEDELGLGKDHSGIMILDKKEEPGKPLAKVLGLDDEILEFDVLPNRAHDCLSYNGMANEICVMEDRKFKIQNFQPKISQLGAEKFKIATQNSKLLNIEIKDKKLCPRYMGAVMSGVKISSSPKWMQNRLIASGMEPINNIVDITNYVMLEIGNPLHAFDFKKIKSKSQIADNKNKSSIIIRKAKEGEELELLDETFLKLSKNDLVIADEEKVLALAGVKGGKYSGISNETSTIILESANFNAYSIRKTRQRHSLLTEAQTRFEKNISPILAEKALFRAVELFKKYAGAKLEEVKDENYYKNKKEIVALELRKAERLLGEKISESEASDILQKLGFGLEEKDEDRIFFSVPYWRLDIEGEEDLFEEIGRIIGYDKIEEKNMQAGIEAPTENKLRNFEWKLKELMVGLGFDEVINYSFYGEKEIKAFDIEGKHLELENPLVEDQVFLKKTLLPYLAKNIELNQKNFNQFAIFEIGKAYFIGNGNMPDEKLKLTGAVFLKEKKNEIFYDIKGRLESLIETLGFNQDDLDFTASNGFSCFYQGRTGKTHSYGRPC